MNRAIVFRRGPTDWIQMSVWNLDDDTLDFGQWINKKVPMRNCDVSPSGKYLIYFVDNFEHGNSRTIISTPPFWTALTVWEHGDALFDMGGGLFADEKTVLLNLNSDHVLEEYPSDLIIKLFRSNKAYNLGKGHINLLHEHRLEMNGWVEENDTNFIQQETANLITKSNAWQKEHPHITESIVPRLWKKKITNSAALYMITFYDIEHRKNVDLFYLGRKTEKIPLSGIKWADIDNRNRIIATKEGKLYASKISTDGSVEYCNLELLHDLNSQVPKRIMAPFEELKNHKKGC